jgi:hypothetical protein
VGIKIGETKLTVVLNIEGGDDRETSLREKRISIAQAE